MVGALLAIAGMCIATYLTVVHYADQPIVCSSIGDCELVNSSKYASLAGVPVALLGAGAYASMLLLIAGCVAAAVAGAAAGGVGRSRWRRSGSRCT